MTTEMVTKIVLMTITFGVLLILANTLVSGASSFSNAILCNAFSNIRHIWESICINTPIASSCVSDSAKFVSGGSFDTPLIGCGTNRISSYQTTANDTANMIAQEASVCWNKFGAGELNVLWLESENPSLCASFFSNIAGEMTAKDLTAWLESEIYGRSVNCTDSSLCCGPGFSCDAVDSRYCSKEETNPFECLAGRTRGTYRACDSGQQEVSVTGYWNCMNKIPDLVCPEPYEYQQVDSASLLDTEPCGYESSTTTIIAPDIFIPVTGDPPAEAYTCKLCKQTLLEQEIYTLPAECTLLEEPNPDVCTVDITYADYLGLGTRTYFSFKRADGSGYLVEPDDDEESVTGQISVFVEYLDSFTGTRKTDAIRYLPEECAAGTFMDSCNGCWEPCIRAIGSFAYLGFGGSSRVSKIGRLLTTEFKGSILGITDVIGISSCINCLAANIQQADLLACDDKLLICVYQYQ